MERDRMTVIELDGNYMVTLDGRPLRQYDGKRGAHAHAEAREFMEGYAMRMQEEADETAYTFRWLEDGKRIFARDVLRPEGPFPYLLVRHRKDTWTVLASWEVFGQAMESNVIGKDMPLTEAKNACHKHYARWLSR